MSKLSEVAISISSGITPLRSNVTYWVDGTIPWLKTEQLGVKYIHDTTEKITECAVKETSIRINPVNTIAIAMYGEGKTRGNVSILKNEMATNQACCNVYLDAKKANHEYVYYFLKTQYAQLRKLSSGVRKNLNSNDIKNFEIRIPAKLIEQQKIAAVLSSLDAKIDLNNRINTELETMAKMLYDYWFVQFDFPGKNGKPYKSNGGKMVWDGALKRDIPEGWKSTTLAEWVKDDKSGDWGKDVIEGNYTEMVSCIRGADINGLNGMGNCDPPVRFILEKNKHKILNSHDLVIEISGGSPTQSTGRIAYITEETLNRFDRPLICSNFCKAISLKNQKMLYNFAYCWNSLYNNGVLFGFEGKTSGIKNLLFDTFVKSYRTVLPDEIVAGRFYEIMSTIQFKKQSALSENQYLSSPRDWLLPMLMNGQVKVS